MKTTWYKATFVKTGNPCFVSKHPVKDSLYRVVYLLDVEGFASKMPGMQYGTERDLKKLIRCERVDGKPVLADQGAAETMSGEAETDGDHTTREFRWRMRNSKRIGFPVCLGFVSRRLAYRNRGTDRLAGRKPGWLADLWRKDPSGNAEFVRDVLRPMMCATVAMRKAA